MNNNNLMDMLSILSIILQLQVYEEQKTQTGNDDIMQELQKQNKAYLNKIIENQNIIMEQLNKLTQEG
ncbi:MAG: hypothetical protein J6T10_22775 [Methanobrevibacter sp.]|nr:hypothetical protein [Methanobrevibacter sp.]